MDLRKDNALFYLISYRVQIVCRSSATESSHDLSIDDLQRTVVFQTNSILHIIQYLFVKVKHSDIVMWRNCRIYPTKSAVQFVGTVSADTFGICIHGLKPTDRPPPRARR